MVVSTVESDSAKNAIGCAPTCTPDQRAAHRTGHWGGSFVTLELGQESYIRTMDHLTESASDLFFVPGNYVLSILVTKLPQLAQFLGLSSDDYSGVLSGFLSALVWLALAMLVGAAIELCRRAVRTVTRSIANLWRDLLRAARMTRTWVASRIHQFKHRKRAARRDVASEHVEIHDLDDLELAALRSHATLKPGFMMTATDLADDLGIRTSESQRMLSKLTGLRLVHRSAGGGRDEEEGYVLSRLGQSFLAAHGAKSSR